MVGSRYPDRNQASFVLGIERRYLRMDIDDVLQNIAIV